MAESRQYFYLEALNITAGQRNTLRDGLLTLGRRESSVQPCERMHSRIRNDNNAIIFEAWLEEDDLTIAAIKARLATLFSVAVGTITHSVNQSVYGVVVTFIQGGQNRIRLGSFAHNGTNWGTTAESAAAARAYLAANAAEWGENAA